MGGRGLVGLALATGLLVAGCSGADESAATTSTSTTSSTTTTTTTRPTTTSITEAPTTTVDPVAEAEDAATAAVLGLAEAWSACIAEVATCDPERTFADLSTGLSYNNLAAVLVEWQNQGWEARPPLNPAHDSIEIVGVEVTDLDLGEVLVAACQIDGGILVDPGAGPDGTDVIVNDRVSSSVGEYVVRRDTDERWRVHQLDVVEKFAGGDGCE